MAGRRSARLALATGLAVLSLAGAARADTHVFTYDPVDDVTVRMTGSLTFEFTQRLIYTTIHRLRSTQGQATAELKSASEGVLGRGGIDGIVGPDAREHDLYEVLPSGEGADLVHAFCPGSHRAWMAFGRLLRNQDLRVRVLGDTPAGGPAHLCATLRFRFHGEWTLPPGPRVRIPDTPRSSLPF